VSDEVRRKDEQEKKRQPKKISGNSGATIGKQFIIYLINYMLVFRQIKCLCISANL